MSPKKEPRYFALEGEASNFQGPADGRGINRWRYTNLDAYDSLFASVSREKAVGKASYSRKVLRRIQNHIPNAKFIAVVRSPVERAYSAFWYIGKSC